MQKADLLEKNESLHEESKGLNQSKLSEIFYVIC
jgi:hypothetical protein